MKNKEGINAINGKIRELAEDELTEVVGGNVIIGKNDGQDGTWDASDSVVTDGEGRNTTGK